MPTYDGAADLEAASTLLATGTKIMFGSVSWIGLSYMDVAGVATRAGQVVMPLESRLETAPVVNHEYDAGANCLFRFGLVAVGGRDHPASIVMPVTSRLTAKICTAAYGLQVGDALARIMSLWGAQCADSGCDSPMAEEAAEKLNAAFQRLHASGKFFGWVAELDLNEEGVIGAESDGDGNEFIAQFVLPRGVQNVAGPLSIIRNNGGGAVLESIPLRSLPSRNALESFSREYAGMSWSDGVETKPLAYWAHSYQSGNSTLIERVERLAHEGVWIYLAPRIENLIGGVLSSVFTFAARCAMKPPRFSCMEPWTRLPVPLDHAETLLLPLARYYAMSSRYFTRKDALRESVMEQAADVLRLLGEMEPAPKEAARK